MSNKWQRWTGIQKAVPFEEKRLAKWPTPYIVQPKFDGIRCRAIPLMTGPKGNEYLLLSSEENVIYSVPHINVILSNLQLRAELDGELYCHGMSFEEILSITSRTINLHHDYKAIKFHVFDIINDQPQMRRQILVDALRGLHPYIEIVNGECHHKKRYDRYPAVGLILERDRETDDEDVRLISRMFQRFTLNLRTRLVFSIETAQSVQEVKDAIGDI